MPAPPLNALPYELRLPLAPSVNHYYLNALGTVRRGPKAGKRYVGRRISPKGVAFRVEVIKAARSGHRTPPRLGGRLALEVLVVPPDRRAFDLDNRIKALQDALTHAGVIEDDALFDDVRVIRWSPAPPGAMFLRIRRFDDNDTFDLAASFGLTGNDLIAVASATS